MGSKEKREEGGPLDREMCGKAAHVGQSSGMIEVTIEVLEQAAARHGESVRRHPAVEIPVAKREGALQNVPHERHEERPRMIGLQQPTPPQQMRQTGLMDRVCEAAIRRPPVADDHAGERPAEQSHRFRIATTGLDAIDRGVRRRDRPEPVQTAGDFPAGFIRRHHRAAANLVAERDVRGPCLPRGAMHSVHQAAARDGQAVLLAKQGRDLAEREPELFIEDDGERDRLRAKLDTGGTQRVGGLQRMTALHTALARPAVADMNAKRAHDDAWDREFFLTLKGDPRLAHRATTRRTATRQRRLVGFVNPSWTPAMRLHAIAGARLPTGRARVRRQRFRERRGLTVAPPPCLIQLTLDPLEFTAEPFVLTLQPIALALRALGALAPLVDLARLSIAVVACRRLRHVKVMPDSRKKYSLGGHLKSGHRSTRQNRPPRRGVRDRSGLSHSFLWSQIGLYFRAPAARSALEHMGVMEQLIEQCGDGCGVAEELPPIIDRYKYGILDSARRDRMRVATR